MEIDFKFSPMEEVNTPGGKAIIKYAMCSPLGISYEVFANLSTGVLIKAIYNEEILLKYNYIAKDFSSVIDKNPTEKPPIGLVPKHIRLAQRKEEIKAAIFRYIESKKQIKEEWIEEYNEIIELEIKSLTKGGK